MTEPTAEQLLASSRYDEAAAAANAELRTGKLDAVGVAARYFTLGRAYASIDEVDRAIGSFGRALALDPRLDLPATAPPKVIEPLVTARRLHGSGGALHLEVRTGRSDPGSLPTLLATVVGDPFGLVARVRVQFRVPRGVWRETLLALPATGLTFDLAAMGLGATAVEYHLDGLDAFDNRLAVLATAERPLFVTATPLPPRPEGQGQQPEETPIYRRGWFWPVVAGSVAAVAGGTFLALKRGGDDKLPLGVRSEVR